MFFYHDQVFYKHRPLREFNMTPVIPGAMRHLVLNAVYNTGCFANALHDKSFRCHSECNEESCI
jgi:hypothetical protein